MNSAKIVKSGWLDENFGKTKEQRPAAQLFFPNCIALLKLCFFRHRKPKSMTKETQFPCAMQFGNEKHSALRCAAGRCSLVLPKFQLFRILRARQICFDWKRHWTFRSNDEKAVEFGQVLSPKRTVFSFSSWLLAYLWGASKVDTGVAFLLKWNFKTTSYLCVLAAPLSRVSKGNRQLHCKNGQMVSTRFPKKNVKFLPGLLENARFPSNIEIMSPN